MKSKTGKEEIKEFDDDCIFTDEEQVGSGTAAYAPIS